MAKTRKNLLLRILVINLAAISTIIVIVTATVSGIWFNEINTVASFKKLVDRNDDNKAGAVYKMDVKGGFYFDKYLEQGGASSDSELISFITENITKGLIPMNIKESDIGCASFTAIAENGDKLFARNYDFTKTNVCITTCDPGNGRHKSFSTVDLTFVGMDPDKDVEGLMNSITCLAAPFTPLDGINNAGLSCGIYMTYQGGEDTVATDQKDPEKDNITSTTMLRLILDYAETVDEAVELIQKYNLHDSAQTSFHYMIADATGKSAILEWVPENGNEQTDTDGSARKLVVHYNTGDDYLGEREANVDFQWVTNFILQPDYYISDENKGGFDRYNEIYNRLSPTDGIVKDEMAAMEILRAIGRRTWKPGEGVTVHSAIYNLTQKTVLWIANETFDDKSTYFTYSLKTGELKTLV